MAPRYIAAALVNPDAKKGIHVAVVSAGVSSFDYKKHDKRVKKNQPTNNNAEKREHSLIPSNSGQQLLPNNL